MEASIVMHYQVIAWIAAIMIILSLFLMVFVTILCCHREAAGSPDERRRLLSPPPQESINRSDEGPHQLVKDEIKHHTQSDESGVVTASESVNLDLEGQTTLRDTSDKPHTMIKGVSEKEDSIATGLASVQVIPSLESPKVRSETGQDCSGTDSSNQTTTNHAEVKPKDVVSRTSNVNEGDHYLKESDMKEITEKIWKARERWFHVGIQLGMSVSDLNVIKNGANHHQPDDCFIDMLTQWLRKGKATWEALMNALRSEQVGYPQLADLISASVPASASHGLSVIDCETAASDSLSSMRKSEEGGIAFRCKCGRSNNIMEYLERKCPCSAPLFPYLDFSKLTKNDRHMLEETLLKDTKTIITEFADLVGSMTKSLKAQDIDLKEIASSVLNIAPSEPSTCPILRTLDVGNITSIYDIIIHLRQNSYISFFNYHIVQYLIKEYGTSEDKAKLDEYITSFQKFCQRSVFKVPQHVYGQAPNDSELLAIKVTSAGQWSTSSTAFSDTSKFSLEDACTVRSKVVKALGIKQPWNLILLGACNGCVVLTFALPQVIMDSVKPRLDNLSNIEAVNGYSIHILCGPPGKPFATNVTSDSISLQWTKPEYQGSHSIARYLIHYRSVTDPSIKGEVLAINEHVTVDGLSHQGAASFVFKVKASSEIEAGVESRESDLIQLLSKAKTPLSELKFPLKLKWTKKSKMPFGISEYPQVAVLKDKVYIGGGNASSEEERKTVIVYDPQQDSYNILPPYTHKHFAMAIVNDNLVLIGGENVRDNKVRFSNELGMWNNETAEWTCPLPPMTTACKHPSTTTYKNRWLVVIGGFNDTGALSRVEILDISSQQWSNSAPMVTSCNQVSLATVGNMCYLLGGIIENTTISSKVYGACIDHLISHNLDASSVSPSPWQILPDTPGTLDTALALNGALFAVGGRGPDIYMYQPSTESWVKAGRLRTGRSACGCAVLSNGDVIVAGGGEVLVARHSGSIGHQKTDQKVDIAILK